jgi:hypothetical protein
VRSRVRWPKLRTVVLSVIALWLLAAALSGVLASPEDDPLPDDFTTAEIEQMARDTHQQDLRAKRRRLRIDGTISVVRVDCAERTGPLVTCLAHVAATGEARQITRVHDTFLVRRDKRNMITIKPYEDR